MNWQVKVKIDFLGLEAFIAVARLGSFTRAAEQLNLSQTAITHRVGKLERHLATKLLVRSARGVSLTPSGAELLPKVTGVLDGLSRELDGLRLEPKPATSRLTVACLPTVAAQIIPPAVAAFATRNPDAIVRILDMVAVDVPALVKDGTADIGITIAAATGDDIAMEPLFTEDYLLVCPRGHRLGGRSQVTWSELHDEKLIRVNAQTANRYVLDQALGNQSEAHAWTFEVQHTATALKLVQAGTGLTVAPRSTVAELESCGITWSELRGPRIRRTISIITRRGATLSPLAQSFRTILKRSFNRRTARTRTRA